MTYVIAGGCCNDASCIDACPVDAIRPHPEDPAFVTAEQLYIDPNTCIDCSACMFACPVGAVHDGFELSDDLTIYEKINAEYFRKRPIDGRSTPIDVPASTAPDRPELRVAVIGAGPAACYAVAELNRTGPVTITLLDRLPAPFGLARSGVAPDHPDTKRISDTFQKTIQQPNVACYFNVDVGTDISLEDLRRSHHAVIVAGGAGTDRSLDISGESLPGSTSAREFVGWYNGHPDFADAHYDLTNETAIIFGNGNVALDVARSLLAPLSVLETTDMAEHAIAALGRSAVNSVVIAGRRGPVDAACSTTELIELCRIQGIEVSVYHDDIRLFGQRDPVTAGMHTSKLDIFSAMPDAATPVRGGRKRIVFRFGVEATALDGVGKVESVVLQRAGGERDEVYRIDCGLAIRAVGYRVAPFPGLPYDDAAHRLSNVAGRIVDVDTREALPGLYCAGWAKRGPSGVIGTNKSCSRETVSAVLDDFDTGHLPHPDLGADFIGHRIRERKPEVVDLDGWNRIDRHERAFGRVGVPPRPRRKLVRVGDMVGIAHGTNGVLDNFSRDRGALDGVLSGDGS